MTKPNKETIKELRKISDAPILECKKALEESNDNIEKALEILRKRGSLVAGKKAGRETKEGLIFSYVHHGKKLGVLLEINCETDFVSKTDEFSHLAKEIAMQIAASSPMWIKKEDVPEETIKKEKEIYTEMIKKQGKPEKILEKITQGKLEKYFCENCLLEQAYIRDDKIRIKDLVCEFVAKFGENIRISKFSRFEIGQI